MAKRDNVTDPIFSDGDPPGPDRLRIAGTNQDAAPAPAPAPDDTLVITQLSAENFKRLTAIRFNPGTGALVCISGPNGAGKSSVLDGIEATLAGKASVPDMPVRKGHKRGEVKVTLGSELEAKYTVKRTFTEAGGGSLTITAKDGTTISSPQALLDELVGDITFDPMRFVAMKAKEQAETVRRCCGLDTVLDRIDADRKSAYDERTDARRVLDRAEAQLAGCQAVPADTPDQEISSAEVAEQLNSEARDVDGAKRWLRDKEQETAKLTHERAEIASHIAALQSRLDGVEKSLQAVKSDVEENGPEARRLISEYNPDVLRKRLTELEDRNRNVRSKRVRQQLEVQRNAAQDRWAQLNRQVEECEIKKRDAVAGSKMPVPGMELRDDAVFLGGVPFSQAATAHQIAASVRLALASNPKIRVVLVREGSLLDSEQMTMLAQIAAAHDAQVWVEKVTDRGQAGIGIVIEDGEIRR